MILIISVKRNSKFFNLIQINKKGTNYFTIFKSLVRNLATYCPSASKSWNRKFTHSKSFKVAILSSSLIAAIGSLTIQNNETLTNKASSTKAAPNVNNKIKSNYLQSLYSNLVLDDVFQHDISSKLVNSEPNYIETKNVENLLSLPRYQNALMLIKRANKNPTQLNYQRVFNELAKLSETNHSSSSKIEELIRLKIIQNFESIEKYKIKSCQNPFLNDSLASYLSIFLR